MAQQLRVSTACPGNLSLVSSTQVQWLTATNHNSIPRRVINCFWPPKHYTHAKVCVRVHEYVCAHAHTQTHIKSLSHIWNIIILAGSPITQIPPEHSIISSTKPTLCILFKIAIPWLSLCDFPLKPLCLLHSPQALLT